MISIVVQCIAYDKHMLIAYKQVVQCVSINLLMISSCAMHWNCIISIALLMISIVVQCIGITWLMISIVVQCIGIKWLMISLVVHL